MIGNVNNLGGWIMPNAVKRRIDFYQIKLFKDQLPVDIDSVFELIHNDYPALHQRILNINDMKDILLSIIETGPQTKGRLGNVRKRAWPTGLVANSDIEEYTSLAVNNISGLYEATHFLTFENGVIGVEYNPYAPRLKSLCNYLTIRFKEIVDDYEIIHLLRRDVVRYINSAHSNGVKNVEITYASNFGDVISDDQLPLGDAINRIPTELTGNAKLKIKIELNNRNRYGLRPMFWEKILHRAHNDTDEQNIIEKLRLEYYDEDDISDIDLVDPYIMSRMMVVKEDDNTRAISSQDMFDKINIAHRNLLDEINSSLNIGVNR